MGKNNASSAHIFSLSILLLICIGYIFKYLEIKYFIVNRIYIGDFLPEWQFINESALDSSFYLTLIFTILFIVFFFVIFSPNGVHGRKVQTSKIYYISPFYYFVIIPPLIFLIFLRISFGAVMGQESSDLPWYLGTFVYRTQFDLMPGLLLFLIHGYNIVHNKFMYYLCIFSLFIFQALVGVFTGSKSGVIFFVFTMVCYWELTLNRDYRRLRVLLPLILLALLAFIAGSQVRSIVLLGNDSQYVIDLLNGNLGTLTLDIVTAIINRFPGQEALAMGCSYGCTTGVLPLQDVLSGEISLYYTYDIVGVTAKADFRSPGFLSGAIMAHGAMKGITISLIAVLLAFSVLRLMDKFCWSVAAKVVAIFGLFRFFMEGAWYWADLLSIAYGVLGVEALVRFTISLNQRATASIVRPLNGVET